MTEQTAVPENFPKDQDELNRIIQNAMAPKLQQIQTLKAENAQLVQEKDSLAAQVTERDATIQAHESTITERDKELVVTRVAHSKNVPAKWLRGDTEEELNASADEFLADAKALGSAEKPPAGSDEPKGTEDGAEKPGGYVASAGTGSEEPSRLSYEEKRQRAYERAKKQKEGVLT